MEQTVKQENEEIARNAKRQDRRNTIIVLASVFGMGCLMIGSKLGEVGGYKRGQEAAQIKMVYVGNVFGNNHLSNDVIYVQNDGTYGVFKYAPKKDYFVVSRNNNGGTIIDSSEPAWQRTDMESNLVKSACEEITGKTYTAPYVGLENSQEEVKINHYTGKHQTN